MFSWVYAYDEEGKNISITIETGLMNGILIGISSLNFR